MVSFYIYIIGNGIPRRTIELCNEFVGRETCDHNFNLYQKKSLFYRNSRSLARAVRFINQPHAKSVFSCLIDSVDIDA